MPTAYLTVAGFRLEVEFLQPEDVDLLESRWPGFLEQKLLRWSEFIDSRLKKRYAVPFGAPVPSTIIIWLVDLVTKSALNRRGYNAANPEMVEMQSRFDQALAQIKEAADSKDGLFDLPTLDGAGDSAITQGDPLFYSETSPYVWADLERDIGTQEDSVGRGTS